MHEILILRKIQSANVIKLYDIYESEQYIHLVMELLTEPNLLNMLKKRRNYNEADAVKIMKSLLTIIDVMHSKYIIYRDLKPDNIVVT